jgi:hypothetical protein
MNRLKMRLIHVKIFDWLRKGQRGFLTALLLFMVVIMVADLSRGRFYQTDFGAYLQAAARFTRAESLYDREPGEISKMAYKYAPAVATLFIPLLVFGVFAAKLIYYVLNCIVVLILFRQSRALVIRVCNGCAVPSQAHLFVAFGALGEFLYREISIGNTNALVSILAISGCLAVISNRDYAGGILLALATLFKPHYALILVFFLLLRRWRTVPAFAAVWFTAFLLPVLVYGWEGNIALHSKWIDVMRVHNAASSWIHDMYGMNNIYEALSWPFTALGLHGFVTSPVYPVIVLALLGAGLFHLWRKSARESLSPFFPLLYVIACTPMLWQVDVNHFVFLMPVVLCLAVMWRSQRLWFRIVVFTGLLLLGGNIYEVWGRPRHAMFYDAGVYGIGASLLMLALVFADLKRRSGSPALATAENSRR